MCVVERLRRTSSACNNNTGQLEIKLVLVSQLHCSKSNFSASTFAGVHHSSLDIVEDFFFSFWWK